MQSLIVDPDVSLLAAASPPERPSSLNPLFVVPPAAIVFALLGCALAVILNRFDRTLHTETEATEALRIPCVGSIPPIPPELAKQPQYALGQPASDYAKAVRSILVSVLASGPASSARTANHPFELQCSRRREDNTSVESCLWAARLGLRTLLLDAGQLVSRRVDESASLLNSLTLDRPLADVIEPIQDLGIDYLPAGFSDGNRLRVLASPKISPLLRQMGEAYDLVVIDGPSLQEAPEARLLAGWVDHVLLVIRCGTTYRETAQTALHQLARTEHLNTAQTARFSSVLTRAEPPSQYNVLGRRAGLLKQIWSAMSRRRRQLPPGATDKTRSGIGALGTAWI